MTTFIAWRSGSRTRPASLYFASDSRRSWKSGVTRDDCIKLYAPTTSPDIFGMVGDEITMPEQVLPVLCADIDANKILPGQRTSAYGRSEWIFDQFQRSMKELPDHGSFSVFHGGRNGFGVHSNFVVFHLRYSCEGRTLTVDEVNLDAGGSEGGSCAVAIEGSGAKYLKGELSYWRCRVGDYSRSYFSSFCDSLALKAGDPLSGGVPQLLALGNTGMPLHLGVITPTGGVYRGRPAYVPSPDIKWRNSQFECVDHYGKLLEDAQRQPRP